MSENGIDRLISFQEAKSVIGVKSDTTFYKMIREGEFKEPIRRGRNLFFLESDVQQYIKALASTVKSRMHGC